MIGGWCTVLFLIRWSVWFTLDPMAYDNKFSRYSRDLGELGDTSVDSVSLPTKIIITFKKDEITLDYFLPEGSGNYPYIHLKETWFNEENEDKNSTDARVRMNILREYLERGDVEIEIATDTRYAYAEFEKGHKKSRIYAYTTHEREAT